MCGLFVLAPLAAYHRRTQTELSSPMIVGNGMPGVLLFMYQILVTRYVVPGRGHAWRALVNVPDT